MSKLQQKRIHQHDVNDLKDYYVQYFHNNSSNFLKIDSLQTLNLINLYNLDLP
ncbi:hypothetical protein RB653_001666 [Dictyostelium firmibasis]|uniref:Uncharacterized protein n=1 Tax=Dictyostelium firmibasis TaxID=79012 RepID=A0AAN7YRJ8_9MYCE